MTTIRQYQVAKETIKKAQARWEDMSARQRARAQPEGRLRGKPGSTGEGKYYHVEVRPKSEFTSFRNQDVETNARPDTGAAREHQEGASRTS